MALVALLKGVNVGGHRTFRPSVLAGELRDLEVVSLGGAGTFVARKPTSRGHLRGEIARRLPFEAHVMVLGGSEVLRLVASDPFAPLAADTEMVRFVSVMGRARTLDADLPLDLPTTDDWCVRVLDCRDRFLLGLHRREMRVIGCMALLEKRLGAPLTTRSWGTILKVARNLEVQP